MIAVFGRTGSLGMYPKEFESALVHRVDQGASACTNAVPNTLILTPTRTPTHPRTNKRKSTHTHACYQNRTQKNIHKAKQRLQHQNSGKYGVGSTQYLDDGRRRCDHVVSTIDRQCVDAGQQVMLDERGDQRD